MKGIIKASFMIWQSIIMILYTVIPLKSIHMIWNITYDTIEEALEQLQLFYKMKEGHLINE